jgi:hypothetical protein
MQDQKADRKLLRRAAGPYIAQILMMILPPTMPARITKISIAREAKPMSLTSGQVADAQFAPDRFALDRA